MDALAAAAAARPQALAVKGFDAAWTYAELDAKASDLAQRLAGQGTAPGQAVGLLLPPSALLVALVHACARMGAIAMPLDGRLPPPELARRCGLAGVRLLVGDQPPAGLRLMGFPVRSVLDLLRTRPKHAVHRIPAADAPAAILFTSGTGSAAKGVLLTHGNLKAHAAMSARHLGAQEGDAWLALVAPWHVGGLAILWRAARDGAAIHLPRRFDPAEASAALDQEPITLASVVPVMLRRILDHRQGKPFPPRLRAVLLGGDAASPGLLQESRALGAPALPTYGLTEACSQVATATPGEALPEGSSGKPLPGLEVRILGEGGEVLPAGEVGEVVVRGPVVAKGYLGDAAATEAVFRPEGLRTGDLGRLDAQGHLFVVGRLGDRITTGGAKVDPLRVEEVLRAHPGVADACVVGLPDAQWGMRVAAAVVRRPGREVDEAALEQHCRAALAPHEVPRSWAWVGEVPRSPGGKVLRREVRDLLGAAGP
jgi:o-succinylbenzoate---CoA ligase